MSVRPSDGQIDLTESSYSNFTRAIAGLFPLHWRARVADWRGRGAYSGYPDRYRCIFIHVPKTAGHSVTTGLFDQITGHSMWHRYYVANPRKFHRYFKFAFVRNPWDRLVSTYHFLLGGGMTKSDADWARDNIRDLDFGQFVRRWLNEQNVLTEIHFRPQNHFIADDHGHIMMDFVGRFETIDADFLTIATRLGLCVNLPSGNRSDHRHYTTYYDDETRDIVASVYAKDIDMFGYTFAR